MIDDGCSQREPVPAWIEQKEAIVIDGDTDVNVTDEVDPSPKQEVDDTTRESNIESAQNETKTDERASKKEAKEARKRERAEKREAKKARKEAREAKKIKKEAKKRKRESIGEE